MSNENKGNNQNSSKVVYIREGVENVPHASFERPVGPVSGQTKTDK